MYGENRTAQSCSHQRFKVSLKNQRFAWEDSETWMRTGGELQIRYEMNYRSLQEEVEGFPLLVNFSFILF